MPEIFELLVEQLKRETPEPDEADTEALVDQMLEDTPG